MWLCRLNESSSYGERLDAALRSGKRSRKKGSKAKPAKKPRKKSAAVRSSKKKKNPRLPRWESRERWYDMEANETSLMLSGTFEQKLKKCMLLCDGRSVVTGFGVDAKKVSNTTEFKNWCRTSPSGEMRVLDIGDMDDLLDANAVGRTFLIQFGIKNKLKWFKCRCVYGDDASMAIIGNDGEEYWWSRETLENDLREGLFKCWV